MSYSFRLKFHSSKSVQLNIDEDSIDIINEGEQKIILVSNEGKSIKTSTRLILHGSGYPTAQDAEEVGLRCKDALLITFAQFRFPVDFGSEQQRSGFTKAGLEMIQGDTGKRAYNDIHGLQVFEDGSDSLFASVSMHAVIGKPKDAVINTIRELIFKTPIISDEKRISFELFSFSHFTTYINARFILLVMALEVLIKQQSKNEAEISVINDFLTLLNDSKIEQKDSLRTGLEIMKRESISAAGRRTFSVLKNTYFGLDAPTFFTKCYHVRSRIVHGTLPRPDKEVSDYCGPLELLVSDVISSSEIL